MAQLPDEVETSKLSVLIPKDIHKQAKIYAAVKDVPLKDVVAEALSDYMASKRQGVAA